MINDTLDLQYTPDLQFLNFCYLVLARQLAATDPERARVVLGIKQDTAARLRDLSIPAIRNLAAQFDVLLFEPRFTPRFWRRLMDAAQSGAETDIDLVRAQAALLAASSRRSP